MPGQFNPDKNLFSVAPVGNIVIIGRAVSLRGGITREYALNLATWLLISAKVSPAELRASIQDAMTGTPNAGTTRKTMPAQGRTVPQPPPPPAPPAKASDVPAEVAGQVAPFIGEIDPEEAAALAEAKPTETTVNPKTDTKIPVVNPDDVANAWGGSNG